MRLESYQAEGGDISAARWQARVDLAAAHRLAVMHSLHEGIFNHLTLRVPGSDGYYQIPFGLHWSEATASCFMEVGYDGKLRAGQGEIERLEDPQILPIGQTEMGVSIHTAYDECYDGPAFDPAEGERLARAIGEKTVLMMANHGVATVGNTVAEAYDLLYYLERAAQVQLYAMWTGRPLKPMSQKAIDAATAEFRDQHGYGGKKPAIWHFEALKRILDRKEPDYKN